MLCARISANPTRCVSFCFGAVLGFPLGGLAKMKTELHILFRGTDASEAVKASIQKFVSKLEEIAQDLMACRVYVELEQKHQHQGRPFGVRIDLTLPSHEIAINKVHNEDVYVALRDAFHAAKRQLQRLTEERRGEVKHHVS